MSAACCRLNFTLSHLDVTCEAYDHFRACLRRLEQLREGPLRFAVEPVAASFPQRLAYERTRQLVGAAVAGGPCPGVTPGPRESALFSEACGGTSRSLCAGLGLPGQRHLYSTSFPAGQFRPSKEGSGSRKSVGAHGGGKVLLQGPQC